VIALLVTLEVSLRVASVFVSAVLPLLFAAGCAGDRPAGSQGERAGDGATTLGDIGRSGDDAAGGSAGASEESDESTAPVTAGHVVPSVAKKRIGDRVFDEGRVQSYYLTFSDAEYAKLMDMSTVLLTRTRVNEERYVQASLRVGDTELPSIAVRLKGKFSIWGCVDKDTGTRVVRVEPFFGDIDVCQRFSLKLDLNEYQEDARLDGLKKLNLHAMAADPSKMRERLGYSLFRDMGLLAPRAVHARLYINGEYNGLFEAVEDVDGRFTANRFPKSGDGNLYKDLWPLENITGARAKAALRTNDDPPSVDVSDFLAFKDAVGAATERDFEAKLSPYIDFDYLARYIVVDRAINNYDGVMGFYAALGPPPANHGSFWYHDSDSGRFLLIPWDIDKTFWYPEPNFWSDNAPNGLNVVPNWNVVTSNCDGYTAWFDDLGQPYTLMAIDCDPLMRLLRGQVYDSQKAITEKFIKGPFSEASVRKKVDAWRAKIADAIEDDPLVDYAHWQRSVAALLADLPKFQSNVQLMMNGLISDRP
jgi:hypothetical protein